MSRDWPSERVQQIKFSEIREVFARVEEAKRKGVSVTNFSIGRPDFDTPDHIKRAAKEALDRGMVHYTATPGIISLREALCRRLHADFGLDIDPESVIISSGATEAIYIALQSILEPGDEVIVPEPMYVYYSGWASLGGAKCIVVPLEDADGFLLTADMLKSAVTSKTKVIILNSPNNPTGRVYRKEDVLRIAELAVERDLMVISDDIYGHLVFDDLEYFPIRRAPGMEDRTIVIGSFSKSYAMDGWRVGYLSAPKAVIAGAMKMHQHIVSCPNTFVQYGAQAALEGPQDCVREMAAEFDRRRRLLIRCLDQIGMPCVRPEGAFYAFPSVKKYGLTSRKFCEFLLEEARVAVVPGSAFGAAGEGHVRISYSTSYAEIEQGMERVGKAISKI
jgi:aminotransferase